MKNLVELSAVAEIHLGQTFRGRAEASTPGGNVRLVQIKDIKSEIMNSSELFPYADMVSTSVKKPLLHGDILLPLRGGRYEAMLYEVEGGIATTTNQVAVIRAIDSEIYRDYLFWYLNFFDCKKSLEMMATGSTVKSIKRLDLANLEIPIVEPEVQKRIGKIYRNWCKQKSVLLELISNGDDLTSLACSEFLNGEDL